ncbi:MAG: hypothetical protein KA713_10610 [Chryseotalea sp. WA131a]|nr:MAG: hypothetical protein KA713_10610 [Chryseotalea sp. WA131a]
MKLLLFMLLLLVLENGRAVNAQVKVFNIHDKKDVESFLGNAEKKSDLSLVIKKDTSQQCMNTSHKQLLYHSNYGVPNLGQEVLSNVIAFPIRQLLSFSPTATVAMPINRQGRRKK